jgi:peptidoglycan hydrolase-like protein with peptidoglycan-binding domain
MGKVPGSVLSIVFQLYLIEAVFADEQVRKAQEELYKRHLFYGVITGEVSPAFTVAISAYQQRKGFNATGTLDLETCASLGLMKSPVRSVAINPPLIFADGSELRGPNGEALPNSLVPYRSSDDPYVELTSSPADPEQVALAAAGDDAAPVGKKRPMPSPHSRSRPRRVQPHKETNPLALAFHTVDHAIRSLVGDAQPKKKRAAASRL